jgi:hypothetical protein
MHAAASMASSWAAEGPAFFGQETAEQQWRRAMFEQCRQIVPKLMPRVDENGAGRGSIAASDPG